MRFTRHELGGILAARRARQEFEGQGLDAFIEFRFKVTPELLEMAMRGEFIGHDGAHLRLTGVGIDSDGYAEFTWERVGVPA